MKPPANGKHAYHLYIILADDRKELYNELRKQNIFAQVHYIPAHTLPYYKSLGHKKGECPQAEAYYAKCLSLPMYPMLSEEEQNEVIAHVLNFINK